MEVGEISVARTGHKGGGTWAAVLSGTARLCPTKYATKGAPIRVGAAAAVSKLTPLPAVLGT